MSSPTSGTLTSGTLTSGTLTSGTASSEAPTELVDLSVTGGEGDDGAADRGRLDVAFLVVRKIAECAADLTEGTTVRQRRLAGVALGESGSSARVHGYGDQVDLRLAVPLAYPAPIATTVDAVRGNVRERVHTLTGYRVRSLDVTVAALTDPGAGAGPGPRTV